MTKHPTRRALAVCLALALLLLISYCLLGEAMDRYNESAYPIRYADTVEAAAAEHGFAPSLIYAVIHTESHFRPDVRSHAGATGLMQITDDTYRWALQRADQEDTYDPEGLLDQETNIRCGVYILHLLSEEFDHTETLLAAYNAGQGKVRQWLEDPAYSEDGKTLTHVPYTETADYIDRVLKAQERYQQIYNIQ